MRAAAVALVLAAWSGWIVLPDGRVTWCYTIWHPADDTVSLRCRTVEGGMS